MSIAVRRVAGRKDIEKFIRLPYGIYRSSKEPNNAWVPPLDIDIRHIFDKKNPMYHHTDGAFWMAWENGEVVGRIAAFVDRNFIEFQKTMAGFFGFFECYNRNDAALALFQTAEEWLQNHGMKQSLGPINGSTNFQLGNQIDSFDEMPVIEMPYSAPFYGSLIESSSYLKVQDLYSYRMLVTEAFRNKKIRRVSAIAMEKNNVVIRPVDMKKWDKEVAYVKEIWEDAWHDNWGFTPWYDPEFKEMAKNLKLVMLPHFTYIAEMNNEPVGFCFPIPDINYAFQKINGKLFPTGVLHLLAAKKKATQLRLAAFGVRREFHNRGIDAMMINRIYEDAYRRGIKTADLSWILESNYPLRNLLEKWGCEHYRTHRLYRKILP